MRGVLVYRILFIFKVMFKALRISVFLLMCYSSVAMAQLLSDTAKTKNEEKIWVPESVLNMSPNLPKCMDLGNGCLGENLNYDKVKDGIEWDKCRKGDEDCFLTVKVKNAEPFVKALVQPFIYNHEKRERQSGESSK